MKTEKNGKKRLKGHGPEHVYNTLGYTCMHVICISVYLCVCAYACVSVCVWGGGVGGWVWAWVCGGMREGEVGCVCVWRGGSYHM